MRVAPEGTAVLRGAIDSDPPLTEDVTVMLRPTGPGAATRPAFRGAAKGAAFELRGATAGEYSLLVTAPDGRMAGTEVVLRDGAITDAKVSLAARR